jgi:hypothetical protein
VARCLVDGRDVAAAMVSQGLAIVLDNGRNDYSALEDQAKRNQRGIWISKFVTPAEYRSAHVRQPKRVDEMPLHCAGTTLRPVMGLAIVAAHRHVLPERRRCDVVSQAIIPTSTEMVTASPASHTADGDRRSRRLCGANPLHRAGRRSSNSYSIGSGASGS